MIEINKTEVFGWEAAIRGLRNPMNSWSKSDSNWCCDKVVDCDKFMDCDTDYCIGTNDLSLMKKLIASGTDHRKFMRMLTVYADITAPLYWWKEFDTYKVGTVANSCSTMHKIHTKEFTLDDFSCEHIENEGCLEALEMVIDMLNANRMFFRTTKEKKYWWQMIQLLPSSYNQKRTVMLNYEVLLNIYKSRKNHKLDEWHTFCDWIESLPYMKEFIE
jgi:hypothetical protein